MVLHGAPLIRCSNPQCRKCHCKECEIVRKESVRVVIQIGKNVAFAWKFIGTPLGFRIKLELK